MDLGLKNKVAVITGAARGIGKIDAQVLAEEGARVVLADVLEDEVGKAAAELKALGHDAYGYKIDVTNRENVKSAVEKITAEVGPISVLVNNAAIIGTVGQMAKYADEWWDKDINVNLTGSYNMTRQIMPGMLAAGFGRIVFMSSIAGLMGGFGQSSYSTTKAGVVGLAKSLALEGARKNVTSNVVAPGIIQTEAFLNYKPEMIERMVNATAMRKLGSPRDVANLIAFLCSERASYITGEVYTVAGGLDLFVF